MSLNLPNWGSCTRNLLGICSNDHPCVEFIGRLSLGYDRGDSLRSDSADDVSNPVFEDPLRCIFGREHRLEL
jgi:hypothetical protein